MRTSLKERRSQKRETVDLNACPNCVAVMAPQWDQIEIEDCGAFQEGCCADCEAEWVDRYQLVQRVIRTRGPDGWEETIIDIE